MFLLRQYQLLYVFHLHKLFHHKLQDNLYVFLHLPHFRNSSMQDANKIVRNADVPPIENEKSSVNEH